MIFRPRSTRELMICKAFCVQKSKVGYTPHIDIFHPSPYLIKLNLKKLFLMLASKRPSDFFGSALPFHFLVHNSHHLPSLP
ncbi:MAG: hypothetical protein JWQ71_388 [Pedosphaera sp.]|nr:hypothetical protein [Pedosphaera sp.]